MLGRRPAISRPGEAPRADSVLARFNIALGHVTTPSMMYVALTEAASAARLNQAPAIRPSGNTRPIREIPCSGAPNSLFRDNREFATKPLPSLPESAENQEPTCP